MRDLITTLGAMPDQLDRLFRSFPEGFARWTPPSWDGIPGEAYPAVGQICHVRDIEIDGYQVRIRRLLDERQPKLVSLDGDSLALERRYAEADPEEALAAFRAARRGTLELLEGISAEQLRRDGAFEGYGPVTLEGLLHFLCSHDQQHLACLQWLLGKFASR